MGVISVLEPIVKREMPMCSREVHAPESPRGDDDSW